MKQYRDPSVSPAFSYTQESLDAEAETREVTACLPALRQQLRQGAEVQTVEADQRVRGRARDSLVPAAGPVGGQGEVKARTAAKL